MISFPKQRAVDQEWSSKSYLCQASTASLDTPLPRGLAAKSEMLPLPSSASLPALQALQDEGCF